MLLYRHMCPCLEGACVEGGCEPAVLDGEGVRERGLLYRGSKRGSKRARTALCCREGVSEGVRERGLLYAAATAHMCLCLPYTPLSAHKHIYSVHRGYIHVEVGRVG
jgi:hypothetical protein